VQQAVNSPGTTLANPLPNQPAGSAVDPAFIPQNSHFAGLDGSGNPIFVNDSGQKCLNFGGTATNCSINLASFSSVAPDARAPYNQQWNLTVQRDVGKGWTLELGYVGSHYVGGLGIYAPFLARLASPANPITVTDINGTNWTITTNTQNNEAVRVSALGLLRRGGARVDGNLGFGLYESAQATLSHRFQKGLYFQSAYTSSKEIDNVSGSQSTDELNTTQNGQGGATLFNLGNLNPALNRSIGDFDRRHRLVLSYVYELPVPKDGIWRMQAFQGWSISGINTYQSGLPFSVTDPNGGTLFGLGATATTGLFTCGSASSAYTSGSIQSRVNGYLNPACFTSNPGLLGNTPRNAFRGPFQQNWDLSVAKHFRLSERHSLDFRTDFFNVLNHPSFRQPATVRIGSATFRQITNTVNPARLVQLGPRYSF